MFTSLQEIVVKVTLPTFVVGYREQEPVVREKLITVLENRGGVTRIRADAANAPPQSFPDNARMAMQKVKAGLESAKRSVYPT